ncbi:hypothetical protein Tco_1465518 [Tanacetum coccineum]
MVSRAEVPAPKRTRNINDVYERIMARMDERLDQFVDQFSNRMNDMMNLRRCGDRNGQRSEDEELGNPFFEGDCSSSNELGDHGVAGDDYEGAPVFDDGYEEAPIFDDDQFEEESMPVYDTDIEDVIISVLFHLRRMRKKMDMIGWGTETSLEDKKIGGSGVVSRNKYVKVVVYMKENKEECYSEALEFRVKPLRSDKRLWGDHALIIERHALASFQGEWGLDANVVTPLQLLSKTGVPDPDVPGIQGANVYLDGRLRCHTARVHTAIGCYVAGPVGFAMAGVTLRGSCLGCWVFDVNVQQEGLVSTYESRRFCCWVPLLSMVTENVLVALSPSKHSFGCIL